MFPNGRKNILPFSAKYVGRKLEVNGEYLEKGLIEIFEFNTFSKLFKVAKSQILFAIENFTPERLLQIKNLRPTLNRLFIDEQCLRGRVYYNLDMLKLINSIKIELTAAEAKQYYASREDYTFDLNANVKIVRSAEIDYEFLDNAYSLTENEIKEEEQLYKTVAKDCFIRRTFKKHKRTFNYGVIFVVYDKLLNLKTMKESPRKCELVQYVVLGSNTDRSWLKTLEDEIGKFCTIEFLDNPYVYSGFDFHICEYYFTIGTLLYSLKNYVLGMELIGKYGVRRMIEEDNLRIFTIYTGGKPVRDGDFLFVNLGPKIAKYLRDNNVNVQYYRTTNPEVLDIMDYKLEGERDGEPELQINNLDFVLGGNSPHKITDEKSRHSRQFPVEKKYAKPLLLAVTEEEHQRYNQWAMDRKEQFVTIHEKISYFHKYPALKTTLSNTVMLIKTPDDARILMDRGLSTNAVKDVNVALQLADIKYKDGEFLMGSSPYSGNYGEWYSVEADDNFYNYFSMQTKKSKTFTRDKPKRKSDDILCKKAMEYLVRTGKMTKKWANTLSYWRIKYISSLGFELCGKDKSRLTKINKLIDKLK